MRYLCSHARLREGMAADWTGSVVSLIKALPVRSRWSGRVADQDLPAPSGGGGDRRAGRLRRAGGNGCRNAHALEGVAAGKGDVMDSSEMRMLEGGAAGEGGGVGVSSPAETARVAAA